MNKAVIGIEGIIGAGKSTFAKKLARSLNFRPIYEPVASAELLDAFYKDPKGMAYDFQCDMLLKRWDAHELALAEAKSGFEYNGSILDRTLLGDENFAKLHYRYGNISDFQWDLYQRMLNKALSKFETPSAIIFLDVDPSVALERVKRRDRGAEANMSLEYLTMLRKEYLDSISEVESKTHQWLSIVMRESWNVDNQDVGPIAERVKNILRIA